MKRASFIVIAVAVLGGLGLGGYGLLLRTMNKTIIVNQSGTSLDDVHLILRSANGNKTVVHHVPPLEAGQSVVVRHRMNDSSVELNFSLKGKTFQHKEPYVDLWTGEGWILQVEAEGTVTSGYESVMHDSAPGGAQ